MMDGKAVAAIALLRRHTVCADQLLRDLQRPQCWQLLGGDYLEVGQHYP